MFTILPRQPIDRFVMFDDPEPNPDPGGGGGGGQNNPPAPKTYTEEQVNAAVQERLRKDRSARETRLAEDLGCTVEEAKAILDQHRSTQDALKDQATRDADAAAKAKADAESANSTAAKVLHEANLTAVLAASGLDVTNSARLKMALAAIDVDKDAAADEVLTTVRGLMTSEPTWFGKSAEESRPPAPPSDPAGGPPAGGQGDDDPYKRGQERAKAASSTASGPGGYDF